MYPAESHSSRPQQATKSIDFDKRLLLGNGLRGLVEENESPDGPGSSTMEDPSTLRKGQRDQLVAVNRSASFLESTGDRQSAAAGAATSSGVRPLIRRDKGSRRRLHQSKSKYSDGRRAESQGVQPGTGQDPSRSAVTVTGEGMTERLDSQGNYETSKNQRRSKKDRKARN